MTAYSAGDVVLVRFPFTDLTSAKRRPAVVLSPPEYSAAYGDVVVMALTSQPSNDAQLALTDWKPAGLPKPTWAKPLIGTIAGTLITRALGTLSEPDRQAIRRAIDRTLDAKWRASSAP